MLADLEIELVENSLAQRHRSWVAVYPRNTGDADQIAFVTLKALVHHPDLFAEALYRHECDDLLDVAEAVARIRTISREMDDDEALPELLRMRDPRQPEWLRTLAGREMARRGGALRDQIAVHDASSVDDRPGQDAGEALVGVECYVHWKRVDERTASVIETPPTKMIVDEYDDAGAVAIYRSKAGSIEGWSTGNIAYRAAPEATP